MIKLSQTAVFIAVPLIIMVITLVGIIKKPHKRPIIESPNHSRALLKDREFSVQIADTLSEQEQGLGGQSGLKANQGMLFVDTHANLGCFWMKDMKFEIDILWFDAAKRLIFQKQRATPASYPETFCPPSPAPYVLEVSAGTAEQLKLGLGDELAYFLH